MSDIRVVLDAPGTSFAVVGATDTPGKYGGIIYRDLKRKGFKVFPVNPNRSDVAGDPTYASIEDIPETPTMAVLVVPAQVGLGVVDDVVSAGVDNVWVQPGAFSKELGAKLEESGVRWLSDACVMVETR